METIPYKCGQAVANCVSNGIVTAESGSGESPAGVCPEKGAGADLPRSTGCEGPTTAPRAERAGQGVRSHHHAAPGNADTTAATDTWTAHKMVTLPI